MHTALDPAQSSGNRAGQGTTGHARGLSEAIGNTSFFNISHSHSLSLSYLGRHRYIHVFIGSGNFSFQTNVKCMQGIKKTSRYRIIFKQSRSISRHKKNGHTFMYPFLNSIILIIKQLRSGDLLHPS
jgi:hypothetical protein